MTAPLSALGKLVILLNKRVAYADKVVNELDEVLCGLFLTFAPGIGGDAVLVGENETLVCEFEYCFHWFVNLEVNNINVPHKGVVYSFPYNNSFVLLSLTVSLPSHP